MEFEFARAHRRFLVLAPAWEAQEPGRLLTRSVCLSEGVVAFFHNQLGVTPAYRSGPVFGHWDAEGERLQVVCAAPAGYIRWVEYDPGQPFAMQAEYVLGWTDALRAMVSPSIDWVGQWLAFPTGVGGGEEEARLVRQAHALQLVDRHRPLLVLQPGHAEVVHAYTFDAENGEQTLEVQAETR